MLYTLPVTQCHGRCWAPRALQFSASKPCFANKVKVRQLSQRNICGKAAEVQFGVDEEPSKDLSYSSGLFNAVNILMGVGILSIPFTLKEGGWSALLVYAILWASTKYTGKILVKCQEWQGPKQLEAPESDLAPRSAVPPIINSYEDIGQVAFGDKGRQFITSVLYTELIGTCALFFILEGDHLHLLLSSMLGPHVPIPSPEALMQASAAVIIPTTWLPDLGGLAVVGVLGLISALGLTGLLLQQAWLQDLSFADTVPIDVAHLPLTFGLAAFVFAGHAVFPCIYRDMKQPERFPEMLDAAYAVVGVTCLLVGVAGYGLYGSNTLEEVTKNLPEGIPQLVAVCLILVSPFTKFALTLEPVAQGVDKVLRVDKQGSTGLIARAHRTGLGLVALALATRVPYFGYVMAIIGSFLTLTVSVIFPSLCYLKLYGEEISDQEKMINYVVVGIGIACAVSGTYVAAEDLMHAVQAAP